MLCNTCTGLWEYLWASSRSCGKIAISLAIRRWKKQPQWPNGDGDLGFKDDSFLNLLNRTTFVNEARPKNKHS